MKDEFQKTMTRDLDATCLFSLLLFKLGNYYGGYSVFYLLHQCKSSYGSCNSAFLSTMDSEYRDYTNVNDYCLQIDKMVQTMETTIWRGQYVPTIIERISFPITECSNLSRFCDFDKESLEWLFSLINMNNRVRWRVFCIESIVKYY